MMLESLVFKLTRLIKEVFALSEVKLDGLGCHVDCLGEDHPVS